MKSPEPLQKATKGTQRPAVGPALLVIGYGNTLRNDDGVGPRVAEIVEAFRLPGVSTLSCALLAPELAEPVSRARKVVFVDAAVDRADQVQFRKMEPAATSQVMAHAANPATILALARDVFGHTPKAWLLTIPVTDLRLGDQLSPAAQAGLKIATQKLRDWRQDLLGEKPGVDQQGYCDGGPYLA